MEFHDNIFAANNFTAEEFTHVAIKRTDFSGFSATGRRIRISSISYFSRLNPSARTMKLEVRHVTKAGAATSIGHGGGRHRASLDVDKQHDATEICRSRSVESAGRFFR